MKMLGYTQEEFRTLDIDDIHPHEDLAFINDQIVKFSRGEEGLRSDIRFKRKDGSIFSTDLRPALLTIAEKKYLLINFNDITERKRMEEALTASEVRYRSFFENSMDAILLTTPAGKTLSANSSACRMFGYSENELIQVGRSGVVDMADSRLSALLSERALHGKAQGESTFIRKDGTHFPAEISSAIFKNPEGQEHASMIIRDITERKQAEKQIGLLAHTLKSVAECVSITDLNDIVLFVNNAFLKTYGYTEYEILGKNINIVRSPNNPPEATHGILAATLTGGWSGELMNRTKDGRDFPVSLSTSFVRDEQGQDIALVGIAADITERKQAEKALKISQENLNELFEGAPVGYHELDEHGNINAVNKTELMMMGLSYEEMIGRPVWEFLADKKESRIRTLDKLAGNFPPNKNAERFVVRRDGTTFPALIDDVILRNERGVITGIRTTILDITERKQAEEELKKSEEKYRSIFENIQDVYYESLFDGTILEISPSIEFISKGQYHRADLIGRSMFDFYNEIKDRDAIIEAMRKTDNVTDFEVPIKNRDGSLIHCSISAKIKYDAQGQPEKFIGSMHDISKRKQAEEALKKSEEMLKSVFASTPDSITVTDLNGRIILANQAAADIRDISSAEQLVGNSFYDLVAAEERPRAEESMKNVMALGVVKDIEFIGLKGNNERFTGELSISVLKDSAGRTSGFVGIAKDITERKQAEEALRETRDYLESLLSFANAPIMVWDNNNKITKFNLAFERMTGYTMYEVLGKHPEILFPAEMREELSALVSRTSDGENLISVEMPVRCKDGRVHIVLWNTSNVYTADGKTIIATIAHGQDISERKHAEKEVIIANKELVFQNEEKEKRAAELIIANKELVFQNEEKEKRAAELIIANKELVFQNEERKHAEDSLKVSELRFRSLYENATIGIYRTTPDGKILMANPALVKMLGYISFEKLAERKLEKDGLESFSQRKEFLEKIEKDGEVSGHESTWIRQDGTHIFVLESARAIRDSNGKTLYYDGTVENITERKSLHNQILQTQKVQSIGTLAGGIAHDFNNILGIILAYTSVLERSGADEKKISKSTTAITQAVSRGTALVRQILTFARQTGASVKPMLIPDLIRELVVMLQETFPEVIEFKTTIENNVPFINADQTQMHQVLLNLCVNARDAMPNGGIIGIEVKTVASETLIQQFPQAKSDRYVSIDVSDTGIGMDEATMGRIFDPFFTTKEQGKGTGLGLSVVYGVIQEHHGFISVESKVGQGTTFHMYFPVAQKEKISQGIQKISTEGTQGGSETILLVEDEELLQEVVQSALESNGYKVLIAADGREAVEIYKKQHRDIALVLSDMGLPKLGGIDVYAILKEINPKIKIIFASGFISLETRSELLKEGAKGFIMKPYSINEVLQMVREVLDDKGENNEKHDFNN